jgi:hypothetical protein
VIVARLNLGGDLRGNCFFLACHAGLRCS